MKDVELLKGLKTPNDDLIFMYRSNINISPLIKIHKFQPFTSFVTLDLVTHPEISKLAKEYIVQLLRNKEKYGFLYHLYSKKLLLPFNLQFNGEMILDPQHYFKIECEIVKIAETITSCQSVLFNITKIELLYFFTLFINIHLNYILLDHILGCNKTHNYLISSRI